jgi:hypothetical protein
MAGLALFEPGAGLSRVEQAVPNPLGTLFVTQKDPWDLADGVLRRSYQSGPSFRASSSGLNGHALPPPNSGPWRRAPWPLLSSVLSKRTGL